MATRITKSLAFENTSLEAALVVFAGVKCGDCCEGLSPREGRDHGGQSANGLPLLSAFLNTNVVVVTSRHGSHWVTFLYIAFLV